MPKRRHPITLLLAMFLPSLVWAGPWQHCATPFVPPGTSAQKFSQPISEITDSNTTIEADTVKAHKQKVLELSGHVQFQQPDARISAESALYKPDLQQLNATGGVRFETEQIVTIGDSAEISVKESKGQINNTRFWLPKSHMRGTAETIELENENETILNQVLFTSCAEGSEDWVLRASKVEINREENIAAASHARLSFKGWPIFYFPYLSFPLEGRKSGLLAPEIGNSSLTGRHIALPYYINLAPNYDATLTPHIFQKQGTMLETEFRFLYPKTRGQIDFNYLADDKVKNDDRSYLQYQIAANPTDSWKLALDYQKVSDNEYFNEFGDSYTQANASHLPRSVTADFQGNHWQLKTQLQSFQTVDENISAANLPYQRLPSLNVSQYQKSLFLGIQYSLSVDYVRFYREQGLTAQRLDIAPALSWPYRKPAGYIEPGVTLRHTSYQLKDHDPRISSNQSRNINQWQLDSGLFFERDMDISNATQTQHWTQTLEPRLFYLNVPFRDQSNLLRGVPVDSNGNPIPITPLTPLGESVAFDSALTELSFAQMFRNNRFTGLDRIGDANQLTAALTSRILDHRGKERWRFSIAQVRYFQDREVLMPSVLAERIAKCDADGIPAALCETAETDEQSDVIAEMASQWNDQIDMQVTFQWRSDTEQTQNSLYQFRYRHDKDKMLKLNYQYQKDNIEQADSTLLWNVGNQWKGVAHWRYSLREDKTLEHYAGLEYQSCCWSIRLLQRNYLNEDDNSHNNSTWIQLEMKGLTQVGQEFGGLFATGDLE